MKHVPLSSKKYPGLAAIVDDDDFPLIIRHVWHPRKKRNYFYAYCVLTNKGMRSHPIEMQTLILGKPPRGRCIDHVDRDGLNNQKDNLRFCTYSQNALNTKWSAEAGVKRLASGRWSAVVGMNYKRFNLGTFSTKSDALAARERKINELLSTTGS